MFKRRWKWFGRLVSDEGFDLSYGHRSVTYRDKRGAFEFGFEDGFLFPPPSQVGGEPVVLTRLEIEEIVNHVLSGIRWEGNRVEVYSKAESE